LPTNIKNSQPYVNPLEEKYPDELKALVDLKKFYQLTLKSTDGKAGLDYLKGREIPDEVIEHFGIGFAPKDDTLAVSSLRNKLNYDVKVLETAGIIANSSVLKDHYSSRVMFPIEDNYGHTVAFSGRKILPEQEGGKYVNYLETPLFKKSEILYHFYKAKETAHRDGYIYVMEGFMDVIASVRAGINSVVGLMGTALTDEHIKALSSLKCEIRLCLDSDEAGQGGMERALPSLLKAGLPFRVVRRFKGGKDADEILTKQGKESLVTQLNMLYDPFLFLFARALRGDHTMVDDLRIRAFIKEGAPYYFALDEVGQARDLATLSRVTALSQDILIKILKNTDDKSLSLSKKTTDKESGKESKEDKPYRDYPSRWKRNYIHEDKDLISGINLGDNKQLAVVKSKIDDLVLNSANPPDFSNVLLGSEEEIIIDLSLSREAYKLYESAKCTLLYQPFYDLASLIGTIYMANPEMKTFDQTAFENLLNSLTQENKEKETQEDDSAFDLDGIDDEMDDNPSLPEIEIDSDEKEIIRKIVVLLACINQKLLSLPQMQKVLTRQKKDANIYKQEKQLKLKSGGQLTDKDKLQFLQYRVKINNNKG
jgi:DNA primase catalytic core